MPSKPCHIKSIVFDLDGTLIDSAPDVRRALTHTLESYGLEGVSPEEIYGLIGTGVRPLLSKAFASKNQPLTPQEITVALNIYLDYYRAHPVIETCIYPGVIPVLTILKNKNITMGICSNKPSAMARLVVEKLNLASFFKVVLCGDQVSNPKPHGDHILETLQQMQMSPEHTVMIGDSHVDQMSAKNASVPFIGVQYGYEKFTCATGTFIQTFSELPAALEEICSMHGEIA
jgi:phosphoglycolate phosphatase